MTPSWVPLADGAIIAVTFVAVILLLVDTARASINIGELQQPRTSEFTKQLEQLLYLQRRNNTDFSERLNNILETSGLAVGQSVNPTQVRQIVRELSHALGTPLAGIKANLAAVDGVLDSAEIKLLMRRSSIAVDVCQAFILAYKNIGIVENETGFLAQSDLGDLVGSALDFYGSRCGRQIDASVSLPSSLRPFSNYQMLAVLLPLLDNAVESAVDSRVSVAHITGPGFQEVRVENRTLTRPPEDFMEDGVTNKEHPHSGLGPGVSKRMASSLGWKLSADFQDNRFAVSTRLEE